MNLKSELRGIGARWWISVVFLAFGNAAYGEIPDHRAFLDRYCVSCHGEEKQKGDRRFDALGGELGDLDALTAWQEILDQLNLGEMPPDKAELHPTDDEVQKMVASITASFEKAHAALEGELTQPVVRRLNKRQYNNTVRTLLKLQPMLADPTESFPPDITVDHFDTVSSALVTSDFLLESYLQSARDLIQRATCLSDQPPKVQSWTFQAPFFKLPARPDGLDEPGRYQHIRKNPTYEDGYLWLDKFVEGVPHDGYYKLKFKAQGINRDYPYDEARVGVSKSEKLRIGVVAGHPGYGDLKAANGSDRPLLEFDLPDDKPQVFEAKVWLDEGYQPRFTFPNGPNRTKPLRSYTVAEFPARFTEFIKFLGPKDGEFRNLPEKYIALANQSKHPVTGRGTEGRKFDSTKFYTNKNSTQGWLAWTRAYEGPRVRVFEVSLEGPFYDEWPTASHHELYGDNAIELKHAATILSHFAFRAFRRPIEKDELEVLVKLVKSQAATGSSDLEAIQAGLQAILCSPSFLYLEKQQQGDADDTGADDHALAARLSYFLWSDQPDWSLRQSATDKKLHDPEVLREQALRLIKDGRSQDFVEAFTDSWLQLDKVGTQPPSHTTYPEYFTHSLQSAMIEETRQVFRHLMVENLPITHFIDSDFTFLNGNLARHYDIDHVVGHHFRKVQVYDRRRGGLLGQAAVLTASANGIDTSPVVRGIWVLENILGTPPNPPPPDIEPIEPDIRGVTTIREQLQKHREVATCAQCHAKIDPLGFALENFDPIGGWRIRYMNTGKKPMVDASGQFPDGDGFADVVELKQQLLERKSQFARCLTEKLLVYATGRTLSPIDRPHVDRIVHELEERGWGFRDLLLLVIESKPFLQ